MIRRCRIDLDLNAALAVLVRDANLDREAQAPLVVRLADKQPHGPAILRIWVESAEIPEELEGKHATLVIHRGDPGKIEFRPGDPSA